MATSDLLDAIAATNLAVIGMAPSAAMAMAYVVMADSIGLVMQNAASHQQNTQVLGLAAMTKVLQEIVIKGVAG
jgi:hypothetical protein